MSETLRLIATTIEEHNRTEEVNILRNHKALAMLKERGMVTFNHSGIKMTKRVRFQRAPVRPFAIGDTLTFAPILRHKVAELDWRGYEATDFMSKRDKLLNSGQAAIIKYYSDMNGDLIDDMDEALSTEIYVDGNASGNAARFHGIESFGGTSGASTKMPIGLSSDTYMGLSTTLGNYGGSWTTTGTTTSATDWPSGTGDAHYDFWTPLVVNYSSTVTTSAAGGDSGWAASTKTWPNTCKEALRFGITHMSGRNRNRKGQLDTVFLTNEMYRQFKEKLESNERLVNTVGGGGKKNLWSLGFGDVTLFEGVEITSEYGVPANVGYGMSFGNIELKSCQSQLIVTEGPEYDMARAGYRLSVDVLGNLEFNPRAQCFFKAVGAAV